MGAGRAMKMFTVVTMPWGCVHMTRKTLFAIGFSIALAALLSACASTAGRSAGATQDDGANHAPATYRIGPEDQIQVNVWRNPDLSVAVPVRPDGRISVPLVGDIDAGGHTPEEVAQAIEEGLSTYVRDPRVTVIVTELRSHLYLSRVRVTGAVAQPISLPYRQGMTVLDLVLEAGGLTEFASANRATLYRTTDNGVTAIPVRLNDVLARGRMQTNLALQPGDVIAVPERMF